MLTTEEKKEIESGFKAAGERIGDVEQSAREAIEELKGDLDQVISQLKRYTKSMLNASMSEGVYQGFWRDEAQAKEFADILLHVAGKKAMGEAVTTEGGVLVPEDLSTYIIQKLGRYGKFRKNAMVVPVGTNRQNVPKIETDLVVYAPEEGGTITASDMEFSAVGLNIIKLCCLAVANRELEEDSILAVSEIIGVSMARSIAKKEDLVGFLGDGTSTYFGMTGITGALRGVDDTIGDIKGLKVASGNAYGEISIGDLEGTVAILPDDADEGAKWYMNRKFYWNVIHPLAVAAGVANVFEILSDRKDKFLLGYPVEFVSAMPSTEANSQICAILGDLQMGAFLGQRKGLVIDRSADAYFTSDQIGFRGIERIDINPFGVGDTSEAGPIVALITAAA